jgi:hypothetical protein
MATLEFGGDNMPRVTVRDIADMTNLHPNTIRNYADAGWIDCKKDFKGWRWFPNPLKTVKQIQGLINGETVPEKAKADVSGK